jgi:hypothetical protein
MNFDGGLRPAGSARRFSLAGGGGGGGGSGGGGKGNKNKNGWLNGRGVSVESRRSSLFPGAQDYEYMGRWGQKPPVRSIHDPLLHWLDHPACWRVSDVFVRTAIHYFDILLNRTFL